MFLLFALSVKLVTSSHQNHGHFWWCCRCTVTCCIFPHIDLHNVKFCFDLRGKLPLVWAVRWNHITQGWHCRKCFCTLIFCSYISLHVCNIPIPKLWCPCLLKWCFIDCAMSNVLKLKSINSLLGSCKLSFKSCYIVFQGQ